MNRRVIEFHALADTDGAGTQNHNLFVVGDNGLVLLLVGGVEVGHIAVKLSGAGVNHLIDRDNTGGFALLADVQLCGVPQLGDILVRKAHALGAPQHIQIAHVGLESMLTVNDVLDFIQEQHVDLGGVADHAQVGAMVNQFGNGKNPVIGADLDILQQLLGPHGVEFGHMQMAHTGLQGPNSLEQGFFDGTTHGHDFAGGLHLGGQRIGGVRELIEGEPGHFGHHIVQGRLEAGGGVGQLDFIQVHTHGDFGGDPGDGVTAGLGGQGGGTGHTGVDLNEVIAEGSRVQSKLDVAATLDFQGADQLQSAVAEQMVFLIGQGLAGSHHDGVASVDAYGIDVLHVTNSDGRIIGVTDDLIFDFLVALDALFHQHLMDR